MPDEKIAESIELGGYKLKDDIWFLDKKGKCRWGVVVGLGLTPQNVPYANIYDKIDRRNITLLIEQLSAKPIDAPMARIRSLTKRARGGR